MLMARNDINDADDEDDRVRRGCIEEEGIFLSVMEDKNDEGCCLRTTELDVVVSRRVVLSVMEDKKGKRCCLRSTELDVVVFRRGSFCL